MTGQNDREGLFPPVGVKRLRLDPAPTDWRRAMKTSRHSVLCEALLCVPLVLSACMPEDHPGESLRSTIGPQGGVLVGAAGTAFAGVRVEIPPGALGAPTEITLAKVDSATPLPATAVGCGPMFALAPSGLRLAQPASVTLPYDPVVVGDQFRFEDEVKVWVARTDASGWTQRLQTDSTASSVTIELDTLTTVGAGVNPPTDPVRFQLHPNPAVVRCLAQYPDDEDRAPRVDVTVVKGEQNDGLFLRGRYIKPGLGFDMFLVEKSQLLADGTVDPLFTNFGLAIYVSDLATSERGRLRASIRAVLLNVAFGFDPASPLAPTPLHELGFWFDDPEDVASCGFNVAKPTPFNPKHAAGPVAMISVPDATTDLGPLCIDPDPTTSNPVRCSTDED